MRHTKIQNGWNGSDWYTVHRLPIWCHNWLKHTLEAVKNWKKREQISKIDQLKRTGERQVEAPLKGGFSRRLFRRRRRRPPQVFFAGARAAGPGFKPGQKNGLFTCMLQRLENSCSKDRNEAYIVHLCKPMTFQSVKSSLHQIQKSELQISGRFLAKPIHLAGSIGHTGY